MPGNSVGTVRWSTFCHASFEKLLLGAHSNGRSTVSYLVRTPHAPFRMIVLIGLEAKGHIAFQARRGIASVVRWNLRPVIFGVD